MNSLVREFSLEWANLPVGDADTICAFFDEKAGAEAFFWNAPREREPTLWICTAHARVYGDPENDTVSARFERVYDLVDPTFGSLTPE